MAGRVPGQETGGTADAVVAADPSGAVLLGNRATAEHFGALFESLPDATLIVNAAGNIVLVNSRALETFGYQRGELVGQPVEILLPERFRNFHHAHRNRHAGNPIAMQMGPERQLFGLRKGGQEFPVEINIAPLDTDAGHMVLSSVRDISSRIKAEQKFRSLLESAPDAMVIVGRDGRIALVNSQMERLFGYPREELLGRQVEVLVPERYRAGHALHRLGFANHPHARAMGENLKLHGQRRDGTELPVEISLSPLETEDGMFVSAAIRDATQRRKVEQSLLEASRMKSAFLANMSHELRTPLNGVIGFSEFLIDGKAGSINERQKEFLGYVLSSGKHLLRLINDVLDLSKIEAGKMDLLPERFAVGEALDEVCSVVVNAFNGKNVQLRREVATSVAVVTLDRHRFTQILYNLLSNAMKFTDSGGKVTARVTRAGEALQLQVIDTGIGIRSEDLPRLFVEFQQLESGSARQHQGSGLGLALTRRIAELHGGSVKVDSTPGQGSTFTVTLPLAPATPSREARR